MMKLITYSQLGKALIKLGFTKIEQEGLTAFENRQYEALIVLPKGTDTSHVSPAHLLTAERTVTENGIASADEYAEVLAKALRNSRIRSRERDKSAASTAQLA